jgi:hypothetical protein
MGEVIELRADAYDIDHACCAVCGCNKFIVLIGNGDQGPCFTNLLCSDCHNLIGIVLKPIEPIMNA